MGHTLKGEWLNDLEWEMDFNGGKEIKGMTETCDVMQDLDDGR